MKGIAALGVLAAALTGCSTAISASSTTSTQTDLDCNLLTVNEAAQLMGGHVTTTDGPSECDYTLKPGTYLSVSAGHASNAGVSLNGLIDLYRHQPGSLVFEVSDHTALWVTYPSDALGGGRLQAVDHGVLIYVTVTKGGPDPMPTAVRAMTEIFDAHSRSA